MPIDYSPGGTEILDLSGNGKGVDINSDIADVDGAILTLADDSFTSLDLCGGVTVPFIAFIFLSSTNAVANALFQVSVGSIVTINLIWKTSALLDYDTGAAPIGTIGTDGHMLLRAASDGRVYLVNRLGVPVKIKMFALNVMG